MQQNQIQLRIGNIYMYDSLLHPPTL